MRQIKLLLFAKIHSSSRTPKPEKNTDFKMENLQKMRNILITDLQLRFF